MNLAHLPAHLILISFMKSAQYCLHFLGEEDNDTEEVSSLPQVTQEVADGNPAVWSQSLRPPHGAASRGCELREPEPGSRATVLLGGSMWGLAK